MLKSFKKFLSVFLTILIIIAGIPTSVYANKVNNKLDEEAINNIVSAQSNENSDKIAAEIRENRTENSKTYLMDDGTYCDVVSAVPIHEFIENKWENVDKNLDGELPETLEESCYLLQAQSSSSLSLSSNENIFTDNNETFLINQLDGNARYGNSISNFGVKLPTIKRGNALIKINSINNYLSQNKIVLSANLNMQYSNLTANMLLKAYEEKNEWDITTNQLSINTTELRLLDYVNINTNNITNSISLDITDSYCRWEKGVVENNGIILNTNSRAQVDFNNICIIVQYKKVSELG